MTLSSALHLSRAPRAAFAVLGLYWGAFAALVPRLKAGLGVGDGLFGLLLLGSAAGLLTAMWLAPRVDRTLGGRALPVAALILAAAFLVPGLTEVPALFCLAMAAVGAASGLTDVVMNTRVSELEAHHGRPLMNANHGVFSAGYAVSAVLTGLAREAGLPPAAVFAVLALVTLALVRGMAAAPLRGGAAASGDAVLPRGTVALCGGIVLLAFMAEAAVESWSALHVERTLGGRAAEGALGPAMLGLTMAVGRFSGQALSGRMREVTVITLAALLAAAGVLGAAAAPTPIVAYLGFGVLGLGVSVIGPLGLALAGKLSPPGVRSEAISLTAVIAFGAFLLAPTVMGGLSEAFGLRIAFTAIGAALLLVPLLAAALARRAAG